MFELLALGIAGGAAVYGHLKSRDFSRRRLRYTKVAENPGVSGVVVGLGVVLVASPLVAILPIVGAGTAVALGAGVGSGVALGAKDE
jgi:hypothetical protein